jgi:hypothetical protein
MPKAKKGRKTVTKKAPKIYVNNKKVVEFYRDTDTTDVK